MKTVLSTSLILAPVLLCLQSELPEISSKQKMSACKPSPVSLLTSGQTDACADPKVGEGACLWLNGDGGRQSWCIITRYMSKLNSQVQLILLAA